MQSSLLGVSEKWKQFPRVEGGNHLCSLLTIYLLSDTQFIPAEPLNSQMLTISLRSTSENGSNTLSCSLGAFSRVVFSFVWLGLGFLGGFLFWFLRGRRELQTEVNIQEQSF